MEAAKEFTPEAVRALQFEAGNEGIVNCCYFKVEEKQGGFCGNAERFEVLMITEGCGTIEAQGVEYPLQAGECCYLPAGMGDYTVSGALKLLLVKENTL